MGDAQNATTARRRAGYVVAIVVNAVLLYAINGWPGWDAVPFLTDDTTVVLGWVNASIVVSIIANAVFLVADPPRLRAFGELATSAVGLYALTRMWQVFPFDFGAAGSVPWTTIVRVVLGVGIVGTIIAVLVSLVQVVTGRRR
ncbi:MAG: hypothetical protein WAX14_16335 [Rhodococcus sp. (in: high G+C Gram-positive bacteria)]|uniref:hypothetical protein n=1 Tax=Rhodococcus sp. TaxID=1831 RepID=UPI003BB62A79